MPCSAREWNAGVLLGLFAGRIPVVNVLLHWARHSGDVANATVPSHGDHAASTAGAYGTGRGVHASAPAAAAAAAAVAAHLRTATALRDGQAQGYDGGALDGGTVDEWSKLAAADADAVAVAAATAHQQPVRDLALFSHLPWGHWLLLQVAFVGLVWAFLLCERHYGWYHAAAQAVARSRPVAHQTPRTADRAAHAGLAVAAVTAVTVAAAPSALFETSSAWTLAASTALAAAACAALAAPVAGRSLMQTAKVMHLALAVVVAAGADAVRFQLNPPELVRYYRLWRAAVFAPVLLVVVVATSAILPGSSSSSSNGGGDGGSVRGRRGRWRAACGTAGAVLAGQAVATVALAWGTAAVLQLENGGPAVVVSVALLLMPFLALAWGAERIGSASRSACAAHAPASAVYALLLFRSFHTPLAAVGAAAFAQDTTQLAEGWATVLAAMLVLFAGFFWALVGDRLSGGALAWVPAACVLAASALYFLGPHHVFVRVSNETRAGWDPDSWAPLLHWLKGVARVFAGAGLAMLTSAPMWVAFAMCEAAVRRSTRPAFLNWPNRFVVADIHGGVVLGGGSGQPSRRPLWQPGFTGTIPPDTTEPPDPLGGADGLMLEEDEAGGGGGGRGGGGDRGGAAAAAVPAPDVSQPWACPACTFLNPAESLARRLRRHRRPLRCAMCGTDFGESLG